MIPLVLVAGTLTVGVVAGLIMRAEQGRGTPRPNARCAPPYDWAQEPDL